MTDSPIPWNRFVRGKLAVPKLVKKFPTLFWNPIVHYHAHNSLPLIPILTQINIVHVPNPVSWKSILILYVRLPRCIEHGRAWTHIPFNSICKHKSSKPSLSFLFPHQMLYVPHLFPIRATCIANLILFCLIIRIIFDGEYRTWTHSVHPNRHYHH